VFPSGYTSSICRSMPPPMTAGDFFGSQCFIIPTFSAAVVSALFSTLCLQLLINPDSSTSINKDLSGYHLMPIDFLNHCFFDINLLYFWHTSSRRTTIILGGAQHANRCMIAINLKGIKFRAMTKLNSGSIGLSQN
jgi:ABC-type sugar transport system permease subunit